MKILFAGGAGYIGSALIPVLLERGYEVDVVDLLWFGNYLPEEVKLTKKDIFDLHPNDLEGYDQVIFLGGLSNDPMAEYDPAKNFIYNAALPAYLAYIAKNAGIKRYIYASSCSVYGYTVDRLYDETSPVTCDYPYGISKVQGENGVIQQQSDDFSVIALRQGTVCGYSPRMRLDLIVNTMFKTAITEGKIIVNNPSIWRPILDIRDAISAYLRAIQADYSISGIYNVASGNYTVGEVGDLVQSAVSKVLNKKIKLEFKNIQDFRNYKVTIEKAKVFLGFHPQYSVVDIIDNLVEYMTKFEDYNNDNYYNIKIFQKFFKPGKVSNGIH